MVIYLIDFRSEKGISIYTLIITIIVLVLIAGTATYTGIDVYNDAKEDAFISQLQYVQNAVNNETSKIELGLKNYGDYIVGLDVANQVNINEESDDYGFITYTPEQLESYFGVQGMRQNFKVNLITKEVKSANKLTVDGEEKDSLKDFDIINQVIAIEDITLFNRYAEAGLLLHLDGIYNVSTNDKHNNTYVGWNDLVTGKNMPLFGNAAGEIMWNEKAFAGHGTEYFKIGGDCNETPTITENIEYLNLYDNGSRNSRSSTKNETRI